MGCDIHMYCEVRRNNKWEKVGKVFKNQYYRSGEPQQVDEDGFEWNPEFTDQPYTGRNYDLFGILADVRNGRGFAGIKTGEGFNPISQPKGLPKDISNELLKLDLCKVGTDEENGHSLSTLERWVNQGYSFWVTENVSCSNPDSHSHSFFTIKEILDYDWGQITMKRGSISLEEYVSLKSNGNKPDSWCGSVSGIDVVNLDENEADLLIETSKIPADKKIYVNYHWTNTYSESASYFMESSIPMIKETLNLPDEDIRLVFWFDN